MKKLLKNTEALLGSHSQKVDLSQVHALVEDPDFWQHQAEGLAIFLREGFFKTLRLPQTFEEKCHVGSNFLLTPLLPLLSDDGRFFVLFLNQNGARLFEGAKFLMEEITPDSMPKSMAEALRYDDPERQLQLHTGPRGQGGRRAAVFHGHGGGTDGNFDDKERLTRYFRKIDGSLKEVLRDERSPLVLAGVEYYFDLYREANTYSFLLDGGIKGAERALDEKELLHSAWKRVAPQFEKKKLEEWEAAHALEGTGRVLTELDGISHIAEQGGIESLWIRDLNAEPEEKLNAACSETLRFGGRLYFGPDLNSGSCSPLCAVLRKGAEYDIPVRTSVG